MSDAQNSNEQSGGSNVPFDEYPFYDVELVIPVQAPNPLAAALSFRDMTKEQDWIVSVTVSEREIHIIDTEHEETIKVESLVIPETN